VSLVAKRENQPSRIDNQQGIINQRSPNQE